MNKIIKLVMLVFILQSCGTNHSIFELSPRQSMSITGKGKGQDAAYNPYGDNKSISVVKNLGSTLFKVRIEYEGRIIELGDVNPKEEKEFVLEKGYELYLDSLEEGKAQVTFKRYNPG